METKSLSPREREIVERIAAGAPQKAIAADLGIAVSTLEVHVRRARVKLGAKSVIHLAVIWTRAAVIDRNGTQV